MQMRVRVSALNAGLVVGENGSALNVTDSRAIARVLAAWLSSTGFLFVAAATGQIKRRRKINVRAAQHAVRINEGLRYDFGMLVVSGEITLRSRGKFNIPSLT